MTPVGRRPGHRDTRSEIVDAARAAFTERGYDGASLRGIARDAGVDPSLVHHYFDGKAALFVAALDLPADPRAIKEQVEAATSTRAAGGRPGAGDDRPTQGEHKTDGAPSTGGPDGPISGAIVVELFLAQWEDGDPPGSRFRAMAQAVSSSPSVADATRQFLAERVWSRDPAGHRRGRSRRGSAQRARLGPARRARLGPVRPADRAARRRTAGRDRPVGRAGARPLHDGRARRLTWTPRRQLALRPRDRLSTRAACRLFCSDSTRSSAAPASGGSSRRSTTQLRTSWVTPTPSASARARRRSRSATSKRTASAFFGSTLRRRTRAPVISEGRCSARSNSSASFSNARCFARPIGGVTSFTTYRITNV